MLSNNCIEDLAGEISPPSHRLRTLQTRSRTDRLLDRYLSPAQLGDRLADLPLQFNNPQPRVWGAIDWHAIDCSQVVGLSMEVFLAVLKGAMTVEAPIHGYSQVSWQYLDRFHQPMARFVGGQFAEDGSLIELGLWEKEERRHSPALAKIYKQLTGEQLIAKSIHVKPYQPSDHPHEDMYRHGLHRVATEYAATCLYLWLMSHSTGALQRVLEEILLDEINHMTKFFGFGIWAFPTSYLDRLKHSLMEKLARFGARRSQGDSQITETSHVRSTVELIGTFGRVMDLVNWQTWHPISQLELIYTFVRVLHRLLDWRRNLTPEYLQELFGTPPLAKNSSSLLKAEVGFSRL